jgi:hypothetical protein
MTVAKHIAAVQRQLGPLAPTALFPIDLELCHGVSPMFVAAAAEKQGAAERMSLIATTVKPSLPGGNHLMPWLRNRVGKRGKIVIWLKGGTRGRAAEEGEAVSDDRRNIAAHFIASGHMEKIESYTQRGRQFASASDAYLKEQFILEMKKWASAPLPWPPITRLNDVEAECMLRNLNLPMTAEVAEYLGVIEGIVTERMKNTPEGETTG